jgi:hypothetical protein
LHGNLIEYLTGLKSRVGEKRFIELEESRHRTLNFSGGDSNPDCKYIEDSRDADEGWIIDSLMAYSLDLSNRKNSTAIALKCNAFR